MSESVQDPHFSYDALDLINVHEARQPAPIRSRHMRDKFRDICPRDWADFLEHTVSHLPSTTEEWEDVGLRTAQEIQSARNATIAGAVLASMTTPELAAEFRNRIDTLAELEVIEFNAGLMHTIISSTIRYDEAESTTMLDTLVWHLDKLPREQVKPELLGNPAGIPIRNVHAALPRLVLEGYIELCPPLDDDVYARARAKARDDMDLTENNLEKERMAIEQREKSPDLDSRTNYMRTVGFSFSTDMANQIAEDLKDKHPIEVAPDMLPNNWTEYYRFTSGHSLGATILPIRELSMNDVESLQGKYNITDRDRGWAHKHYQFAEGFGDLDFTAHFSAAIANEAMNTLVADGVISGELYDRMTLTDWADMMRTPWFSRLLHSMAFTGNNIYGDLGVRPEHYEKHATKILLDEKVPIRTPDKDINVFRAVGNSVDLTPQYERYLRQALGYGPEKSPGCPVARRTATFAKQTAEGDHHLQALLARGEVELAPPRPGSDRVRVYQHKTAIDRLLLDTADKLAWYDATYGTPQLGHENGIVSHTTMTVTHHKNQPLGIFRVN